jgi:AdoMet-dependent heme synthase
MELAESVRKSEDLACCFRSINKKGVRVLWETTKKCNMNCMHCLASSKSNHELNTKESKNIIEQLPGINTQKVLFSGGEPLLRHDIFELISAVNQLGIHTDLNTNAVLLDEKTVTKLANTGLRELTISMDGANKNTFKKIRGTDNFDDVLNAFKLLKNSGFEFDITCVATKLNFNEIGDIIDLAYANGAGSITINNMFVKDNAKINEKELLLSDDERQNVISTIQTKRQEYKKTLPIRTLRLINTHPLEPCGAATSFAFIDAEGFMHPCSLLVFDRQKDNNTRQTKLRNIFNSDKFNFVRQNYLNKKICTNCDQRKHCGLGCRGFGLTFKDDFFYNDSFCNICKK